jgi:hypothetical protein
VGYAPFTVLRELAFHGGHSVVRRKDFNRNEWRCGRYALLWLVRIVDGDVRYPN